MLLTVLTLVCVVAFFFFAFLLKHAFMRMLARYESIRHVLADHELQLLSGARNFAEEQMERAIDKIARERRILDINIALFRFLFPGEYDRAIYAGDRIIAQYRRLVALSMRAS